jgi:hypothetical protein
LKGLTTACWLIVEERARLRRRDAVWLRLRVRARVEKVGSGSGCNAVRAQAPRNNIGETPMRGHIVKSFDKD